MTNEKQSELFELKTHYCVGFLFNFDKNRVILIRKLKPAWQFNRLNGVGGKVEPGETSLQAMYREFREEVFYPSKEEPKWKQFATLDCKDSIIDCFATVAEMTYVDSKTPEKVEIVDVEKITPLRTKDLVENVPWMVSMAIDFLEDGRPASAIITYK